MLTTSTITLVNRMSNWRQRRTTLLSEQGALDKETEGWASNWAVENSYQQPLFPPHLIDVSHPMTLWAFDIAAASFPIDTGLGADNVAPRAVLRLPEVARRMIACRGCAWDLVGGA